MKEYGELVPTGGGETILLRKDKLLVGRREGCDIILRFSNVSSQHAKLSLEQGYWFVRDLGSRNGTKVDDLKITRKRLDPGAVIAFAKHSYKINYDPQKLGAIGIPPSDDDQLDDVLRRSLLNNAGLERRDSDRPQQNKDILDEK